MTINNKKILSREEFFKQGGAFRFEINPLDMELTKGQSALLRRFQAGKGHKCDGLEETITLKMPALLLSSISICCNKVNGLTDIYELALKVIDNTKQQVAWVWLTMGTLEELETMFNSPQFIPLVKKWVKWFDYALKAYPVDNGQRYYWSEWEPVSKPHRWLESDPDLYGFSSSMSSELLVSLRNHSFNPEDVKLLFRRNMDINCRYSGASRNESLFESMSMSLSFYDHGHIDLVGRMWFTHSDDASRIIIHSFDSVDHCELWLNRKTITTEECCSRMADLVMQ